MKFRYIFLVVIWFGTIAFFAYREEERKKMRLTDSLSMTTYSNLYQELREGMRRHAQPCEYGPTWKMLSQKGCERLLDEFAKEK